jgi:transposase
MTATEGQPTPLNGRDFHILWLMKEGHTPDEVASMLGYTARWVRTLVQRWNRGGEPAIRDHRRLQKGAPPRLAS